MIYGISQVKYLKIALKNSTWIHVLSYFPAGGCLSFLGLLLGEFICHRRRPYTTAPEGRLDTLHWLSLPLSVSGFGSISLSISYSLCLSLSLSTFVLSLFSHHCLCPRSLSLYLSLPFPPAICQGALHWARTVNRLQQSTGEVHKDQPCEVQMGLLVHSVRVLTQVIP